MDKEKDLEKDSVVKDSEKRNEEKSNIIEFKRNDTTQESEVKKESTPNELDKKEREIKKLRKCWTLF